MSTTVHVDGWNVTGDESAEDMVAALTPAKADDAQPKVTVKDGQPVKDDETDDAKLSEAAAELGKKGGKAAAEKRAAEVKAKPADPDPEALAAEAKVKADQDEADTKKAREGNPRHDPKARIAELARERREAQAQAAEERRRAEQLEARLAEIERKVTPPEQKPTERPTAAQKPRVEDFEDFDQYLDARDSHNRQQWEGEQKEREHKATVHAKATKFVEHIHGVIDKYQAQLDEARASDPEFDSRIAPEVRSLSPSLELQPGEPLTAGHVVADEIISSGKVAALMLHFTQHPDELQRVLALRTPDDVKVEVRLIGRSLGAVTAGASPRPTVSKAPSPVRPVTGTPPTADQLPDENDSYDEHVRKMSAQERRAQR